MIINIVAGGPEILLPDLNEYDGSNVTWVGVDKGVFYLLKRDFIPSIAFGDFDSVSPEELTYIQSNVKELRRYQPEKDETDMELALNWSLKQDPEEIRLFGATGGRLDHMLANVQLLIPPLLQGNLVDIQLFDRHNHLSVKSPGTYKVAKNSKKYISFIPVTMDVANLTLEGFKYPLKNRHISIGSTLCISNELISEYGTFSFSEGIVIMIRSDD